MLVILFRNCVYISKLNAHLWIFINFFPANDVILTMASTKWNKLTNFKFYQSGRLTLKNFGTKSFEMVKFLWDMKTRFTKAPKYFKSLSHKIHVSVNSRHFLGWLIHSLNENQFLILPTFAQMGVTKVLEISGWPRFLELFVHSIRSAGGQKQLSELVSQSRKWLPY